MPNYVDTDYSENYAEGDTPSAETVECDTKELNAKIDDLTLQVKTLADNQKILIENQNKQTTQFIEAMKAQTTYFKSRMTKQEGLSSIRFNDVETLLESNKVSLFKIAEFSNALSDKITAVSDTQNDILKSSFNDLGKLVERFPSVANESLYVYPNGTDCVVAGFEGNCKVLSSRFTLSDNNAHTVLYTIEHIDADGRSRISEYVEKFVNSIDKSQWYHITQIEKLKDE